MSSKRKRRRSPLPGASVPSKARKGRSGEPKEQPALQQKTESETGIDRPQRPTLFAAGGILLIVFLWSYWPTFTNLVDRWYHVDDYSHGFLVIPVALGFLWYRKDQFPRDARGIGWGALVLVCMGLAVRIASARCFLPSLDGWSIPFWWAGACVLFGGWRMLRWCLPSLVFLLFMVPLPFRAESALSAPLRRVATTASCASLQCLGQPAVEEGTTIFLEDEELNVARECSGLRMLMGIAALAFAYIVLTKNPWWQKALLLASIVPVAVVANVIRVTCTALLYRYVSSEAARSVSHDAAGMFTTFVAAGIFAGVLWCFHHLFVEIETITGAELLRATAGSPIGEASPAE